MSIALIFCSEIGDEDSPLEICESVDPPKDCSINFSFFFSAFDFGIFTVKIDSNHGEEKLLEIFKPS